jgi:hypothetical protein
MRDPLISDLFGFENGDQQLIMKNCIGLFHSNAFLIQGTVRLLQQTSQTGKSLKCDLMAHCKRAGWILKCKKTVKTEVDDNKRIVCIMNAS